MVSALVYLRNKCHYTLTFANFCPRELKTRWLRREAASVRMLRSLASNKVIVKKKKKNGLLITKLSNVSAQVYLRKNVTKLQIIRSQCPSTFTQSQYLVTLSLKYRPKLSKASI